MRAPAVAILYQPLLVVWDECKVLKNMVLHSTSLTRYTAWEIQPWYIVSYNAQIYDQWLA